MQPFACVLLVDRRGRVLMQERDEHPVIDPDKWGFCGGHLEAGEQALAGAVRELEEETGVRLAPEDLELVEVATVFHQAYGSWDEMTVFAAGVDLDDDDIVCGEGRQIVFVDPDRLLDLDLTGSAAQVLPGFLSGPVYSRLLQ